MFRAEDCSCYYWKRKALKVLMAKMLAGSVYCSAPQTEMLIVFFCWRCWAEFTVNPAHSGAHRIFQFTRHRARPGRHSVERGSSGGIRRDAKAIPLYVFLHLSPSPLVASFQANIKVALRTSWNMLRLNLSAGERETEALTS